jgi:beta-galactosidase
LRMKPVIYSLFIGLMAFCPLSADVSGTPPRDWENPAVFSRGQETTHATMMPFRTLDEAMRNQRKESSYCLLLNGTWKFRYSENPEQAPADFHRPEYNVNNWQTITVPGNWQMQGFGRAQFRNVHQPFPADPPRVPSDYNPTGSYRRSFSIPGGWENRRIFLHFEGVKSASTVWVNGLMAGYNEGGMEPAEYDITPLIRGGENVLAVRVLGYSDGTYLECQDMWRLFGIHRDVYLMAAPLTHIRDFRVETDLDGSHKNAMLKVRADVRCYQTDPLTDGLRLKIRLFDTDGRDMFRDGVAKHVRMEGKRDAAVDFLAEVKNPRKWSAEKPNLYTLVLELEGPDGVSLEYLSSRVGFRKVEIRDQAVWINGVRIKFNGVNSHVHHPVTGRAMDVETMRRDLTLMKQFNINCVRTSHYPPNVEYLDLADELGMYIVDETGDEAHATEALSDDPAWRDAYVNRGLKMVLRDRNHPCVVIWSAGNESGSGQNIAAVIREGKRLDPSRPGWCYGGNTDLLPFEDIVGPRYPNLGELEKVGRIPKSEDPRPSFMDEYLAASGNSLGNLDEYWDLIWKYPRLTGGAVWDWISPGILRDVILTPDSSPRQNAGALMGGAELVTGRSGNAVSLSGHDDWVEAYNDSALDLRDSLTLQCRVFPRRWNGYGGLVMKGDHQYGLLQKDAKTLEFYIQSGERRSVLAVVPESWEYRWHLLAGTYDGRELCLFVDGRCVASGACSGRIDASPYPLAVGRSMEIIGMEHAGDLSNAAFDDVRIHSRALSLTDLEATTQALKKSSVLWWDFDETWNQGKFFSLGIGGRAYGLVWPDRTVQPELWQLKKSPQPVRLEAVDLSGGKLRIANRYNFTNLNELEAAWQIEADDTVLQYGNLDLDLPPGDVKVVRIPFARPELRPGVEYRLLVSFRLPKALAWAPAGHEVAWEQFVLPNASQRENAGAADGPEVREEDPSISISGSGFRYVMDRTTGTLTSILFNGIELLKSGPALDIWRAPTSNETERDWGGAPIVDQWRRAGLDRIRIRAIETLVRREKQRVVVSVRTVAQAPECESGFENDFVYTFGGNGNVSIEHRVKPFGPMPEWLPKVGIQMTVSDALQQFTWHGRGPFETYPDRKTGAKVGVFSETVDGQYVPYLVPQDYGNKTDVRWAALTGPEGVGLFVCGEKPLNVSVHHYDTDNLTRALYPFRLVKQDGVTLNVDPEVCGLGETPIKTQPRFRVLPEETTYRIRLQPFDSVRISAVELGRLEASAYRVP